MVLCELDEPANACNVDDDRGMSWYVRAALCEQPQERGGHKVDGEGVDLVYVGPSFQRLIVEHCAAKRLCVLVFRSTGVLEEGGDGPCLACAVEGLGVRHRRELSGDLLVDQYMKLSFLRGDNLLRSQDTLAISRVHLQPTHPTSMQARVNDRASSKDDVRDNRPLSLVVLIERCSRFL